MPVNITFASLHSYVITKQCKFHHLGAVINTFILAFFKMH